MIITHYESEVLLVLMYTGSTRTKPLLVLMCTGSTQTKPMCCDKRAVHALLSVVQYLRQQPRQHSRFV